MRHSKTGLALLLALVFGLAGSAQATSFTLGNISGRGSYTIYDSKDPGQFTDKIHFTIDPGVSLIFKASVINYTWRHGGIYDMDGTLSDASGVIRNADAETIYSSAPYPNRLVTFPATTLGPGHYFMSIFGNSFSDVLASNTYLAHIQFAATPLPASLLLMLTALGTIGGLGWHRLRKSADGAA
jgi:hypothetical protein